jgi:hypothetical protein
MSQPQEIRRHRSPDPAYLEKQTAHYNRLVILSIENVPRQPDNLGTLIGDCVGLADYLSAANPNDVTILSTLRVAAQAALALYRLLVGEPATEQFDLGDHSGLVCARRPNPNEVTDGCWVFGMYAALICNDEFLLRSLAPIPFDRFVSPTIRGPAYHLLYAKALQAHCTAAGDAATRIERADEAAREVEPTSSGEQYLLLPQVQLLRAIISSPGRFPEAFREAVRLHKRFCVDQLVQGCANGYFAFRLMGLLALALRVPLAVDVISDYTPLPLLDAAGYKIPQR